MLVYNIILLILFVPAILFLILISIFNNRLRTTFLYRLGFNKIKKNSYGKIWFHCSSLGEFNAIKNVISIIHKKYPPIFITTLTDTGYQKAVEVFGKENVTILPLDFNFLISNLIKKINPIILIIEETEIWPNLIYQTVKRNIPVVYVNALISKKSFKFYKKFKFVFNKILQSINLFFVQNFETAQFLKAFNIPDNKINFVGNIKFDIKIDKKLKKIWNTKGKIITAGSIREGEEKIFIYTFKKLKNIFPEIKLILAPRHLDRIEYIITLLKKNNLSFSFYSKFNPFVDVLIIDKLGVLLEAYFTADITFVGGTIVPIGGHNPIEPAILKKPVIFGKYIKNNFLAFDMLLKNNGGVMVYSQKELYNILYELLKKPDKANKIGINAFYCIEKNKGSSEKIAKYILNTFVK